MPTDSLSTRPDSAAFEQGPAPESYALPANFAQADRPAINTVLIDSIARDTVSGRIPHFIPVNQADSLRVEALIDSLARKTILEEPPSGLSEGLAPEAHATILNGKGGLTALLAATIVVAAMSAPALKRSLKGYWHELWSSRKRPNVFDEGSTSNGPAAVLLALVFIIFGGLVLYFIPGMPPSPSFAGAAAAMSLMAAYYIFQLCAYNLVGYAFASGEGRRQWLTAFMAAEAYTGIALIIPALLLVYVPQYRTPLIITSLSIFFALRLLFICKGLRIFYRNFRSLLYFILYLCTLEIIPLLALYSSCVFLWSYTA